MNKCDKCGFLHYRTDPCRKPRELRADYTFELVTDLQKTEVTAPPKPKRKRAKDTRKGDRHRAGYWADYFRKRRAKQKAEGK